MHIKQVLVQKNAVNHEVDQHIGTSRGGKTTKIHAIVDGLGNPVSLQLSSGAVHDSRRALSLLSEIELKESCNLEDSAYGSKEIRSYIVAQGANYVIPPKKNTRQPWATDWSLYKERHIVECFFNKLKNFRRVATRYDKLATSFLAFVHISAIAMLVK